MLLIILYSTLRAQKNLQVTYTIHKHNCILTWVPGVVRFCFGKGDYGPYRVTSKFENWTPWKPFERYRRESFFSCSESCSWIDFLQPTWTIFMVEDIKILQEMHSLEKVNTFITILEKKLIPMHRQGAKEPQRTGRSNGEGQARETKIWEQLVLSTLRRESLLVYFLTAAGAQRNPSVGAYTFCPQNFQHPACIILISLVTKCLQMVIFCFSTWRVRTWIVNAGKGMVVCCVLFASDSSCS